MAGLRSGRHAFYEKPLATEVSDAVEVADAAQAAHRALVVDHVLRHNPILRALTQLRGGLLGPVQRFCFENDASDEDLPPNHWFWDEAQSGGIFVEHGVHFFDAARLLVGSAPVSVAAKAPVMTTASWTSSARLLAIPEGCWLATPIASPTPTAANAS